MTDDSIKRKPRDPAKKPQKRTPKPITDTRLRNMALYYLQRYASSSQNLRNFLNRRVMRASQFHETDKASATGWIDTIIADFERSGLLNDEVYAKSKVESLRRRGDSKRAIAMKLQQKGLSADQIGEEFKEEDEEAELKAALRFVERRRLGSHRKDNSEEFRDKDLASLARAGFSYDVAKKALLSETRNAQ